MNNIANSTTLWQLLGKGKVVVPILQRDYAQGRVSYENLREKFLAAILSSLNRKKQLKLDFVYGSSDDECRFIPLDGQQRLTTLWLLHWYLAYRLGKLAEHEVIEHLSNFSYETRFSSSLFCQQIVKRGGDIKLDDKENISDAIIRQTWIPSVWRQDPTVQSMLRMLSGERNDKIDGIEELFEGKKDEELLDYWNALMLPAANCPLVFYQLDLENLGLSDDLYVKMNGRGKPLSDFENFKADLIKYIADNEWKSLLDPVKGLPVLLDTKWLDFFWNYRTSRITLDDMIFGFINRYLLVRMMLIQIPQKIEDRDLADSDADKAFKYLYSFTEEKNKRESYNLMGFGVYHTIFDLLGGFSVLYDLRTVLDNICRFDRETLASCVRDPYEKSDEKFEVVYTSGKSDPYRQTIPETISYWAVCQFLQSPECYCTGELLARWMRIVWNVCNYKVVEGNKVTNEIRSKTVLRSTILSLQAAFQYKWDVYNIETLSSPDDSEKDKDKTSMHIIEEQEKIRRFNIGAYKGSVASLQGKNWEQVIVSIEMLPVFYGSIRALFMDANGNTDWSLFDKKYTHIMWYLEQYADLNSIAYRNLLFHDYSQSGYYWFPKGYLRDAYWRGLLPYAHATVHHWLMATPMDGAQLSTVIFKEEAPSYAKRSIIQTTLLQDVTCDKGMYATHSWTNGYDVYIYHGSCFCPYVVFNDVRDKVVNDALNQNIIQLSYPDVRKPCGLFYTRDILFRYQGKEYIWHARGVIYLQEDSTHQLPQPDSISALINTLDNLQHLATIKTEMNSD